jgi:hypothetical protein
MLQSTPPGSASSPPTRRSAAFVEGHIHGDPGEGREGGPARPIGFWLTEAEEVDAAWLARAGIRPERMLPVTP